MSQQAPEIRGPIPRGKTRRVIDEVATAAGTTTREFGIDSDSALISLFVESTSGDVDVVVKTLTEDGKEFVSTIFPTISSATANLVIRKAATAMTRLKVEVTYTGACTYEVRAKAIGFGEVSTKLLGAADATASQKDIGTTPTVLIPSALSDRAGLVVKNYGQNPGAPTLFIGFTAAEAASGNGFPLEPGEPLGMDIDAGQEVYAVASSGTVDVRIIEAGG